MPHPWNFPLVAFFTSEFFLLLYKGHTTLLLFIRNQHRLRAGSTLPIFEQSLGFYHCFGVLVVSHEEGVVLLLLRAFVELVVGLAYI